MFSMLSRQEALHDRQMPPIPMSSDEIVNDLIERIRLGQYPPGTQLPTYASLSGQYNVSVATIAIVIRILRERGAVIGVRGRGTFVPEA